MKQKTISFTRIEIGGTFYRTDSQKKFVKVTENTYKEFGKVGATQNALYGDCIYMHVIPEHCRKRALAPLDTPVAESLDGRLVGRRYFCWNNQYWSCPTPSWDKIRFAVIGNRPLDFQTLQVRKVKTRPQGVVYQIGSAEVKL
jgi:hypothetical protein